MTERTHKATKEREHRERVQAFARETFATIEEADAAARQESKGARWDSMSFCTGTDDGDECLRVVPFETLQQTHSLCWRCAWTVADDYAKGLGL